MIEQKKTREIDIVDLLNIFIKYWITSIIIIGLASVISVFYAISLPNTYQAKTVIAPKQSQEMGLGQAGGSFSPLANLAGISLPGDKTQEVQVVLAQLTSRQFTTEFFREQGYLVDLLGTGMHEGEWQVRPDLYDGENETWLRTFGRKKLTAPTDDAIHTIILKSIQTDYDQRSGLITITFRWPDPEKAKTWLSQMIADLEQRLYVQKVKQLEDEIDFLENSLVTNEYAAVINPLSSLLSGTVAERALLSGDDGRFFKTIDPAYVLDARVAPNRFLICIVGFALGLVLAFITNLTRSFLSTPGKAPRN